jgi:Family of unknown function (DUF6112)
MRWLTDVFTPNPNPSALPGSATFQSLVNAVTWFALVACLVAVIIGAVTWAFGSSSTNAAAASKGQKTVAGGIIGAVIIGASSILINFFYHLGFTLSH